MKWVLLVYVTILLFAVRMKSKDSWALVLNDLYLMCMNCSSVFFSCAFVAPALHLRCTCVGPLCVVPSPVLPLQGEKEGFIKKRDPSYVPKTKERLTEDFAGVLRLALFDDHDRLPKV